MRAAHSYYEASSHPAPARPELRGTVDCDVCVIGAGIAGCSTALHLAERGYRVYLMGGLPGVAEEVSERLSKAGVLVVGRSAPKIGLEPRARQRVA